MWNICRCNNVTKTYQSHMRLWKRQSSIGRRSRSTKAELKSMSSIPGVVHLRHYDMSCVFMLWDDIKWFKPFLHVRFGLIIIIKKNTDAKTVASCKPPSSCSITAGRQTLFQILNKFFNKIWPEMSQYSLYGTLLLLNTICSYYIVWTLSHTWLLST